MPSRPASGPAAPAGRTGQIAAAALAVLAVAIAAALAGASPALAGTGQRSHALRSAAEVSSNWAGYAVTSASPSTPVSFTSVTGTWTQSRVTCSATDANAASAVWVGLGGYDLESQALEQIGTDADCDPAGKPTYYAWYELVPEPVVNLWIKIRPGDTITTSVNVSGSVVWLQLKNRTTGARFDKKVTAGALDTSSAEWVAEAPSSCSGLACRPLPLANFGRLAFSRIATIGDGHPGTLTDTAWSNVPIQLVPHSGSGFFPGDERGLIQFGSSAGTEPPGTPTADGKSFTLAWAANPQTAAG
jgi:hypothetical protein